MSAQFIPVAFASVFVAGCLAIQALQRWSEIVARALAWIFVVVVVLLMAEGLANHRPRQYVAADRVHASSTRASPGAAGINQHGPTQMHASTPHDVPAVFHD